MALLFPDQNSKSLKMLKGLQAPVAIASRLAAWLCAVSCSLLEEFAGARRLRETARVLLDFDPLEGPGFQGFYELLRGPEGLGSSL